MKTAFLSVLFSICFGYAFSQSDSLPITQRITGMASLAAGLHTFTPTTRTKNAAPLVIVNLSTAEKASLIAGIRNLPARPILPIPNRKTDKASARNPPACADTSFARLMGITNSWLYIQSVSSTADDGVLISGVMYDTLRFPGYDQSYGFLIKLDQKGQKIWLKQFEYQGSMYMGHAELSIRNATELPNHDIVCTGLLNNNTATTVYKAVVFRLTSTGDVIWKNIFESNLSIFNSPPGSFSLFLENASEGLNGDLLLCGTNTSNYSSGKFETVMRVDNTGHLIWDAGYGNNGVDGSYRFGAQAVAAFLVNNNVKLVGLINGTNSPGIPPGINICTLDYASGQSIDRRFFRPQYGDYETDFEKSFTASTSKFLHLDNGHYLFYGKLFSDFVNLTAIKDHYGVVEFDEAFTLVGAYAISSPLKTNFSNNMMSISRSGHGIITVFEYITPYTGNLFFGSFSNVQFQQQRKAYYPSAGMPGSNGFAIFSDGSYGYLQTYFKPLPDYRALSYLEFKKMHDTDTTSQCLGKDTSLLHFTALHIVEDPDYGWLLDGDSANTVSELALSIVQTDTTGMTFIDPCKQPGYCDTLKIHGNPVICGGAFSILFNSFKNPECGAITQWNISSEGVDSIKVLTDSSVRIYFKNINWQGKLYASLPGGKCLAPVYDSMAVSIIRLQEAINLGADTIICAGNTIIADAGTGFNNYTWQDGSHQHNYSITIPGIYYVTADDACGNVYSDTLKVTAAAYPFSIGRDTLRCNIDSIKLFATPGFSNYNWYNNYKINTTVGRIVKVYPDVDTLYFATAEKFPGCMVSDTIRITVKQSPLIHLGADTSFCAGETLTLHAGSGFAQYVWNNGATAEQLPVNTIGNYFVKATAVNGCSSYDTLKVLSIAPRPVFSLGKDSTLCAGNKLSYNFTLANATYAWQDGSTVGQFVIMQAGQYHLTVNQNGCAASDTVGSKLQTHPYCRFWKRYKYMYGENLFTECIQCRCNIYMAGWFRSTTIYCKQRWKLLCYSHARWLQSHRHDTSKLYLSSALRPWQGYNGLQGPVDHA